VQLESNRALFENAGAQIVAISTDTPQIAEQTRDELGLNFRIVPDNKRELVKLYNHKERYTDLNVHNPAVYIVDRSGVVRFAHFGQDAGDRPDPVYVYSQLLKIQQDAE